VPRTAPGDVVEVEYTEQHSNWRRARVVRLVTAGPDRREPPCQYYARCGGCQLQHISYDAQLRVKADVVRDCLRRLGGVDLAGLEVDPSPDEFSYRNRISLVARRSDAGIVAGYHGADDPDEMVGISACPIAEDPINAAWAALAERLDEITLQRRADTRMTLRSTADGRVGLAIETTRGRMEAPSDVADMAGIDSVWWLDTRGRVVAGAGEKFLNERWGAYEIPLAGTAFLQVNRGAAARLDTYVIEQCQDAKGQHVIDAYCGFGLRALELARNGVNITAIDVDRRSIKAASRLAKDSDIDIRFVAAAVERALPSRLPVDTVILNPPRRGVARPAIDALAKHPPRRIIYVSCDPATLARDVKALGQQFTVTGCRAFDLFPQTAHVETVMTLTCE
jgi:23S rRNA (uracil1939-C5)-methyltransferase